MNKTVTFDPDLYKLVPCNLTDDMRDGWDLSPNDEDIDVEMRNGYRGMLAAVPDQLPGVVEHSGELVGYLIRAPYETFGSFVRASQVDGWSSQSYAKVPLYTHPAPSQPNALIRTSIVNVLRNYKLSNAMDEFDGNYPLVDLLTPDGRSIDEGCDEIELIVDEIIEAIESQPSAEALVQAALEAAAKLCDNHAKLSSCVIDQHLYNAARCIRALSAQQIIESCKEKS